VAQIVVVGSVNIDLTCYLERWPEIGETVTALESTSCVGGKGANQAVAASRLGGDVLFVGAIGMDSFGEAAVEALEANQVALAVDRLGLHTGLAFIDVGPDGRNIIRLRTGANRQILSAKIDSIGPMFTGAKIVLLQNEIDIDASLAAARIGRGSGAMVIMDPAPAPDPLWPNDLYAAFDIITPNATEAGMLLGNLPTTLQEGLEAAKSLERAKRCGVIITMGECGVAWSVGDSVGTRPCPIVNAIDTVAAGDCFNGALAVALASGSALQDAIGFAIRAASIATTKRGAIDSLPFLQEIEKTPTMAP
jgi:ribokinase